MSDSGIHLPHLRALIGLKVRFFGENCLVVEVLDEPPSLVLVPLASSLAIQADAHGRASEFAQDSRLVRVLSPDRQALGDDLMHLELLE